MFQVILVTLAFFKSISCQDMKFPSYSTYTAAIHSSTNRIASVPDLSAPYNYTSPQKLIAQFNYTGEDLYSLSTPKTEIANSLYLSQEKMARNNLRPNATDLYHADEQTQIAFSAPFKGSACASHGTTFRAISTFANYTLGQVGCDGCDPYNGDSQCWQSKPLLCFYSANMPRLNMTEFGHEERYYNGWSGGLLELTKPVRGCYIRSQWHGDWLCRQEKGEGWRMANFNEGRYTDNLSERKVVEFGELGEKGGFNFFAMGDKEGKLNYGRYWVVVEKTKGNCWDN